MHCDNYVLLVRSMHLCCSVCKQFAWIQVSPILLWICWSLYHLLGISICRSSLNQLLVSSMYVPIWYCFDCVGINQLLVFNCICPSPIFIQRWAYNFTCSTWCVCIACPGITRFEILAFPSASRCIGKSATGIGVEHLGDSVLYPSDKSELVSSLGGLAILSVMSCPSRRFGSDLIFPPDARSTIY